MKISTGPGTCTAKTNSPALSVGSGCDNLCDRLTGSTVNHPRPDIAISQAGLPKRKKQEISYLSAHKHLTFFAETTKR